MSNLSDHMPENGSIFIDGPAGKVHIKDFGGTGPLVLSLHGVTGCTHLWGGVAEQLAGDFHLLAFDYRGHGRSDWSETQDYTTDAYADDLQAVVAWIADKTDEPLILMGSSWGALAMLKWMEKTPANKVESLIIVDVEPSFGVSEYAVPHRPYKFPSIEAVLEWEREANPSAPVSSLEYFAQESVVRTADGDFVRRHDPFFLTRWPFRNDDLWPVLPHINVPVLILNGDRSFVKESACREMVSQLPNAEYTKVEDSGHLIPLEQPQVVSERVREFLKNKNHATS